METSLTWLDRLANAPSGPDWRRLVDVYAPLLADWLARAGVPASDRDDLVQEVLVAVVGRVSDFDRRGPGAFRRQVFDDCKAAAVAAELGLTVNGVLLAKSRVLKRLRDELRGLVE